MKCYKDLLACCIVVIICLMGCKEGDNYYYNFQKEQQLHKEVIYDYLVSQRGTYDSLVLVLERIPELKQKLKQGNMEITLFAVNNRSFSLAITNLNIARNRNALSPMYLEDIRLGLLDSLMYRYVFEKLYPVSAFENYLDGQSIFCSKFNYEMHVFYEVLTSSGLVAGGQQQLMFSDMNASIYQRYWNRTNTATVDFNTQNGVIHNLSADHEFGFGKMTTYLSNTKL